MKRKNKILAGLAIGAVALAIASGAVRCSASDQETSVQEPREEQALERALVGPQDEGAPADGRDDAQGGFADLKNTKWESEDGKSALSIIEGALIEAKEDGTSILYYTIKGETRDGDSLTATLSTSATMTGDEEETVAVVRSTPEGGREIVCDKLACKYKQMPARVAGPITLEGTTDDLYDIMGKSEGEISGAITEQVKASTPSATVATWGKEVWIDYASGTRVTNFTLNDAAATIVSVQVDSAGKIGVL